ncbi:MAG: iron export ABC transporter permease subunit FetB [Fidelibacterota bacterium]
MDTIHNNFYHLTWIDILISLVFVLATIMILRYWKIGLTRTLLIGTLRTFVQLTAMGYILTWFFHQDSVWFMVGLILSMTLIASYEGYRRVREFPLKAAFPILFASMTITLTLVLGTILKLILKTEPWYYPYAMIPIAGMIIGNALNSATLSVNRFVSELEHREDEIEMMLSLGAPVRAVVEPSFRAAVKAALLPTINSMMMVGLVQLPGVMTGQILAGIDPLVAVRYQIMIMYMWVTTAALMDVLVLGFSYKQFFTSRGQFRADLFRSRL